ncbi:MAG: ABC transporter permease [Gammaproteobacteria bacterium]|nr:ABC transporter permease [Gammaproteobacteria bacterium]
MPFLLLRLSKRSDFKSLIVQLTQSYTVIICSLVFLSYISICLTDSIHYKTSNNSAISITSLLDYIMLPWSEVSEETFSAPFANTLYTQEKFNLPDGTEVFGYPDLKYSKTFDLEYFIIYFVFMVILNFIIIIILSKIINYFIKKTNKITYYNHYFPRKTFYISLFIILTVLELLIYLTKNYHIMGTDKIGRDVFYLSIKSIRTGVLIGSLTTLFVMPLSITFGTLAGYYGGKIDDLIQYLYTTLSSIPGVLLIAASILIIQAQIALHPNWFINLEQQADFRLLALCFILSITSWSGLCRLIRAETLKIKQLDYILAARSMRVKANKIIIRHIIPNLSHIIILSVVLDFSGLVLAEAVLSYIGVGVDATTASWGNMINSARSELSREPVIWWTIIAAFVPMFILVLTVNLLADKLRDALDPRTRLQ